MRRTSSLLLALLASACVPAEKDDTAANDDTAAVGYGTEEETDTDGS